MKLPSDRYDPLFYIHRRFDDIEKLLTSHRLESNSANDLLHPPLVALGDNLLSLIFRDQSREIKSLCQKLPRQVTLRTVVVVEKPHRRKHSNKLSVAIRQIFCFDSRYKRSCFSIVFPSIFLTAHLPLDSAEGNEHERASVRLHRVSIWIEIKR